MTYKTNENEINELNRKIDTLRNEMDELIELRESAMIEKSIVEVWRSETERMRSGEIIRTGIKNIDKFLYGFRGGDQIVIGGQTSMGKTALALSIIAELLKQDKKVLLFSLEMNLFQNINRLASIITKTELWRLQYCKEDLHSSKFDAFNSLIENSLIIKNESRLNIMKTIIEHTVSSGSADVIFVDHIGLVDDQSTHRKTVDKVGHTSRTLKNLAMKYNVPMFVLAQFNRGIDKEKRPPILSDLRDSGNIEQDADIVLFPYRKNREETATEIIVAKNRNGKTGVITGIEFQHKYTHFVSCEAPTNEVLPENMKPKQRHFQDKDDVDF